MEWVQTISGYLWWLNIVLLICGTLGTWLWVRGRRSHSGTFPPVTILKPLKGVDPGLAESLETFLKLDYPQYEVTFSVADDNDPAVPVVRKLLARYPSAPAQLVIGEEIVGPNPKVNNLVRPLALARHEHIVISDSYIRATPDYLQSLIEVETEKVATVTGLRRGCQGRGLGGKLEEHYINCFYARWQILARGLKLDFVVGSTMMFTRSFANQLGGLPAVSYHASEDYAFGEATRRHGKKIGLTHLPVTQYIGDKSFRDFWYRHQRWGTIRKYAAPQVFFIEWQHGATATATFALLYLQQFGMQLAALGTLGTALFWMACDALTLRAIGGAPLNPGIWLLKEAIVPFNWLHALFSRHITWRGNKLRIGRGGRVHVVKHSKATEPDQLSSAS